MPSIHLTDTATGRKSPFAPADPTAIGMYVCGPTVYDRAHLGNARSAVVFDLLYRVLRGAYGPEAVTYARNFTDVDDKIIAAAEARYPELEPTRAIGRITRETIEWYHEDMDAIGVLRPDFEPRATVYIAEMVQDIETMIEKGVAYEAEGHVFFSAEKNPVPGHLSGRKLDDETLHRVEPNPLKRHPADFVLWKPARDREPGWDSPWGYGRPGWHIECSAMATRILGSSFDIHGGGADLAFPHHDNEMAQAKCCAPKADYARTWLHNGMITVDGRKMSKSLGNFTTVADLRSRLPGGAIRLALLAAQYRANLDWSEALEARSLAAWSKFGDIALGVEPAREVPAPVLKALYDDLNTAQTIAELHALYRDRDAAGLAASLELMGISLEEDRISLDGDLSQAVEDLLARRTEARAQKDFATSDRIRDDLIAAGVEIKDGPEGTSWEPGASIDADAVKSIQM